MKPAMTQGKSPTIIKRNGTPDRTQYTTFDTVRDIWCGLDLPLASLDSIRLMGSGLGLPSSFKLGRLAHATITVSALAAALVDSVRNSSTVATVRVDFQHAVVEFLSERYHAIEGSHSPPEWGPIGGLYRTADRHVRIHDNWLHHRNAALKVLGLKEGAGKGDVRKKMMEWKAEDLESAAANAGAIIFKLRDFEEWDKLPQARAVPDFPITVEQIGTEGMKGLPARMLNGADKCLRGLRVLELSRVIAAPVGGRTLAAHGADILWVTSPNLADLPSIDRDVHRGKRTIQLDLNVDADCESLRSLIRSADVFIQSYRPKSLADRGFSPSDLVAIRPGIIYANLSAWSNQGPWSQHRGFDSIVQVASGMNVSEAKHYGDPSVPARATPCQALDHAAGYLLATGITAAVYRRALRGGSWEVNVSLAGVMKYLRSLGQWPGNEGFQVEEAGGLDSVRQYLEERESGFGTLLAVRHSAEIEGKAVGWDVMPKPLGSDKAEWL